MTSTSAGSVGPGTVLAGRYRLEDLLVESSGAWFWRATDTVLARSVAVHAVGSDDDRAPLMLDAARLSATVNDAHLLRVLDCAEEGPVCWVVHEWGEGLSLDLMLERGPLAPTRAAWLAQEVADAIAAGHAQGVAHGRLNPEAVLVTHSGSVKLIGYVVDASLHRDPPTSPVYGELDAREADVIDVAGVLYAALTGRWPGVAESSVPPAPLDAGRPLRPRQVRAGVPRALDAICERVLHRDGARHELPIESAHELAATLADVTDRGGQHPGRVAIDGPDDLQEEPTAVISRAALAEEARRRAPGAAAAAAYDQAAGGAVPDPDDPGDSSDPGDPGDPDDPETTQTVVGVDTGELEATQAAVPAVPASDAPATDAPATGTQATDTQGDPGPGDEQAARVEPPPPPPFLDSPERPLFSELRRRVPTAAAATAPAWGTGEQAAAGTTTTGTSTTGTTTTGTHGGAGAGGPESWPYERDDEPRPATQDHHEGRGWLRTAVAVGLLLVTGLAVVVAFSLGRGGSLPLVGGDDGGEESPSASASAQPVRIQAVTDVDPPPAGNGEENPDTVGNVIDGDPATSWTTVTYYNRPDLGGLKPGVGLMLDLGSDQQVGSLTARFGQAGTGFSVYAAPEGVTAAPTGPDAMRQVGNADGAGERATVELEGAPTTRFVLLWLTTLPASPDGYQGEVAEVQLRS
ncbi:protein kinase family protein [Nocardioides marmoraquaticus]